MWVWDVGLDWIWVVGVVGEAMIVLVGVVVGDCDDDVVMEVVVVAVVMVRVVPLVQLVVIRIPNHHDLHWPHPPFPLRVDIDG